MGEKFNDREYTKGHPVDKPFGIILFSARFNGMNGHISWIKYANYVAQELCTTAKYQIKSTEGGRNCK